MRYAAPRWIRATRPGHCAQTGCDETIRPGDRVFYYPVDRCAYAVPCGHAAEQAHDWQSRREDEDNNTSY